MDLFVKCHLKLHIDITLHYILLTLTVASLTRFSAFLLAGLSSVLVAFQLGGSVAEWLAGLRRRRNRVRIAAATLSDDSLRQTVHIHRSSVHRAAKLTATLLRVARVTEGMAESNGSLPPSI